MGLRPHSQPGEGELIWKRSQKPVRLLSAARLFKWLPSCLCLHKWHLAFAWQGFILVYIMNKTLFRSLWHLPMTDCSNHHKISVSQRNSLFSKYLTIINPIRTGLFERVLRPGGGGILGLGWVRVPNIFGNDLSGSHLSYIKGFMKFGWPEPPQKMIDFSNFSLVKEASDPVCYEIVVYRFFSPKQDNFMG